MRTSLIPLAGLLPVALIAPLSAQSAGPVTNGSGAATWVEQSTPTGTRTVFTVNANSILEWPNGFNLRPGNEIVFDFVGGSSVVNIVGGTDVNTIGGAVSSNGNVSFTSPQADLLVSGSITANSATLSTLRVDPAVLLNSSSRVTFTGNPGSSTGLLVTGSIESHVGDIIFAGQRVTLGDGALVKAKSSALIAGGSRVELDRGLLGLLTTIKATSGDGFVYHLGRAQGLRIEVAAGRDFLLKGQLQALQILLEVGDAGKILKDVGGLLLGDILLNGILQDGDKYGPNDSHASSPVPEIPASQGSGGDTQSASRGSVSPDMAGS